jgi:hypothetical protein
MATKPASRATLNLSAIGSSFGCTSEMSIDFFGVPPL